MLKKDIHGTSSLHVQLSASGPSRVTRRFQHSETLALCVGVIAALMHLGAIEDASNRINEVHWVVLGAMIWICVSRSVRACLTFHQQRTYRSLIPFDLLVPLTWLVGLVALRQTAAANQTMGLFWTEAIMGVAATLSVLSACRRVAASTKNSAVLLVGSFLIVITHSSARRQL